eukprot:m51a1_g8622 putative lim domain containing protein (247) ;mRNA; f:85820-86652
MSASNKCASCGKTVYAAEMLSVDGVVFHKASCFRCCHCNCLLRAGSYASLAGKYYCKPHFKQLFATKGNYSEGFGEEKPAEKWAREKNADGSSPAPPTPKATPPPAAAPAEEKPKPSAAPAPAPAADKQPAPAVMKPSQIKAAQAQTQAQAAAPVPAPAAAKSPTPAKSAAAVPAAARAPGKGVDESKLKTVAGLLEALGLGAYRQQFEAEGIEPVDLLRALAEEDVRELGLSASGVQSLIEAVTA